MQAFRDALERSRSALESNVDRPRERVQEVVDDAVKRGRMTRADANELVSNLVSRSRKATDDLIRDLEKLLEQARKEVEADDEGAQGAAAAAARYLGAAGFDDELELKLAVARLGATSLATRIVVTHDSRTVAEGEMRHVFVDPATRAKRPIPRAVRSALEPFVADSGCD